MTTFTEIPNVWIPLPDGRRLAARLWLPNDAEQKPVPAVFEYLPYRKRDGTAPRDESTYPVFAENGYAGVRVDIAGHGESDGSFDDEYSESELTDGVAVIHWISEQPWCNGNVGMMGISWGGFNSLQIAALNPPPLKATITIGTVVDRYNKDIHYKNGCQLYTNFAWANVMLCYASRPPDPLLRDDWKKQWIHRLKTEPWLLETWLNHQRRDDYWKHGSVCEDFSDIKVPSLVMSGWCDLYVDAPVAAIENFSTTCKAINGPWIHKYPHFAWPKPRLDFHKEALDWWDHWLTDSTTGVENLPDYRAFIAQNTRASTERLVEEGRWVSVKNWQKDSGALTILYPNHRGGLEPDKVLNKTMTICSPQDCGTACGEIFTLRPDGELPGDQRYDDGGSLTFDTDVLVDPVQLLGATTLDLDVAIDQPLGNIVVRLLDVHPDGMSHRISWGALNLAHRNSQTEPSPMTPGQKEQVTITLNQCGYRILAGHRIRLAISTAYWPSIMPPPSPVTASIYLENTRLVLPTRTDTVDIELAVPDNQNPLPEYIEHQPAQARRWVERDIQNRLTHYFVSDDTGEYEIPTHGMRTRHLREECWTISPDNPLSSKAKSTHTFWMSRKDSLGDWSIRTDCNSSMSCDAGHYHLQASVKAYAGDELVNERTWACSIERDYT